VLIAGGGTGGHLMPALAIAEALRSRHPEWRLLLVGARRGVEATVLPTRDFPFVLLPFEPIYRRQWWKNLRWPWLAIRLLLEVRRLLRNERPNLVLGTGGYASGPVVWSAARAAIPTAILEQDAVPGLATRRLAGLVREIWLGAPEAAARLAPGAATAVVVTGSPITPPSPERRASARTGFGLTDDRPTVLVFGGSQGSLAINRLVADWLAAGGASHLTLLWATGRATAQQFRRWHAPPAVQVVEFLDPIANAYAVADLVVSRAGMMTIAELCAWGLPSVLIPLPSAAADHQTKNAAAMAGAGAAVMLVEGGLTAAVLGSTIEGLLADRGRLGALAAAARARGRPRALADIVGRLEGLIGRGATFSNL
jgi:UDP-N-acetylglucosamine--N-acetylmuramyl-(pentapeptide) pyrophosphoryl-undecaprenol N-acetylglucosamine transferase